jgi:hypothetical protein
MYRIQYVTSGVMLLIGVGYAASTSDLPQWYGIIAAVLSALWTYTGITADRNVTWGTPEIAPAEPVMPEPASPTEPPPPPPVVEEGPQVIEEPPPNPPPGTPGV